jgi:hypothetical protein
MSNSNSDGGDADKNKENIAVSSQKLFDEGVLEKYASLC